MYDNIQGMGVDPRSIAQRIMEVLRSLHCLHEEEPFHLTCHTSRHSTVMHTFPRKVSMLGSA